MVRPEFTYPLCGDQIGFGLGPLDFATIYNVLPLWNAGIDGTGETITLIKSPEMAILSLRM